MKTLRQVPVGASAIVKKLNVEGSLKRRLMDMGITKGVELLVQREAPFGDPLEIRLRGFALALRKSEAECIVVE